MVGYVNSFQSMGAVDGPGLRCVVFMQGCPLRCAYCHNPDTWEFGKGEEYTPQQMFFKIMRYKAYIAKGGVTVSGGEPLAQWQFVKELFRLLKAEGIHTALDTSGICSLEAAKEVLQYTDLVLCDIKFPHSVGYADYCQGDFSKVLQFLALVEQQGTPLWVRHVVVPNLTDSVENIRQVYELASSYCTFEKLELLPFRKLCIPKYQNLGLKFPLEDVEEMPVEGIEQLYEALSLEYK